MDSSRTGVRSKAGSRVISIMLTVAMILSIFSSLLVNPTPASAASVASDKAYNWLKAQMKPSGLVESFENGGAAADLCVVYDQAVAAEAFVVKGDLVNARKVLATLKSLQWADGGWHNIYKCSDRSVVEWHRDVGPAVWVALAVAKYELATGDTVTFHDMALGALNFAYGFQQADGGVNGGFEATPDGYRHHAWGSTEHNEDVYAASRYFYGDSPRAGRVKWFLTNTTWDATANRWLGGRADTRDPLDVNAWGVSALGATYTAALDYNLSHHRSVQGGIDAFDFNSDKNDIWFEGTGQMVVAFKEAGRTADANFFLTELIKGQKTNGGIPYSLNGTNNGYWTMTTANAVSSAAWLIFADAGFNPLKVGTAAITSVAPSTVVTPPAGPSTKAYDWLKLQLKPSGLVESFENGGSAANLCVVYDEAVAAEAFVVKGDFVNARKVLATLKSLQRIDGSWYNIYSCSNTSVVEWHRDVGPAVWVALAVAKYELATGDTVTFRDMALRALNFSYGFQQADGGVNGGFEATPDGYRHHAWGSTEHNEDVYAASRYFYGDSPRAGRVKWFLTNTTWDATANRWLGGRADTRDPLDVNAWGVSALGATYAAALDYNLSHHRSVQGGIDAFDFNSDKNDIWFEGTGQMVVAFKEAGRTADANFFLTELIKGQKTNGGIPYSLNGTNNGYWTMTTANAVSSAAWLIFADAGFNPLKVGTAAITSVAPSTVVTPPAGPSTKAYDWLKLQLKPSGLVESFENGGAAANLCVVYDEAVAAEAFVVKGDLVNARKVLATLQSLQFADGGWYNIYSCTNMGVVEWHRDVGPAVWVALAVAKYELATGDTVTFRDMGVRALNFAYGFQQADGGVNGGFEATPSGIIHHTWGSTEHNEDVYAASRYFPGYAAKLTQVKSFLETVAWDATANRWLGGRADTRDPLDVNAWGVSALGATYAAALDYNLSHHRSVQGGIDAFDFNSDKNDIWFEGTGQMVVAFKEAGRTADANFFLTELIKGQKTNGGIPYSLNGTNNGYWTMTAANAVSSAAWLIFADAGFNPLKVIGNFDTQAPTAPTNLISTGKTFNTVTLSWTAATDNVGVASYSVFINNGTTAAAGCAAVTTTSCTVTGLSGSTTYSFTAKAADAAGNVSPASNAISVTTDPTPPDTQAPTAPTNLISTGKTHNTVTLSWTAATDNVGVTSYSVFINGGTTAAAGCAAVTTTSCTVTGLSASTTYSFTAKARDAAGNVSPASNAVSVTTSPPPDTQPPTAPTNLISTGKTFNTVTLSWTAATDNVAVTSYSVFINGAVTAAAGCAAVTTTSCTVTGLSAGTTYSFTVKAADAAGNISPASAALSVTTSPLPPFGNPWYVLDGAAAGTPGVLSSTAGSAAASDIIPASGNGNGDGTPASALVYQASNLTATYDASKTTQFKLYIDAASTVGNGTQARVSFDFTGDGTWDRVETYNYFATDPVTGWELYDQTRGLKSTSGAFANLSNGKVRVEIWNALGSSTSLVRTSASSADGQQSIITLPFNGGPLPDTQAPTVPTNLTSPSKTSTTVTLSWTAATDNVAVTSYSVFINGGATAAAGCAAVTTTSCTVTGLSASTAYSFTVKARDAAGNVSPASTALSVTTNPPPTDTQAPTTPINLVSPSKTSTTVTLSWTASTDNVAVTSYSVFINGGATAAAGCTAVTTTSCTVTGLSASTTYSFTATAADAAGNASPPSTPLSVTTNPIQVFTPTLYVIDGAAQGVTGVLASTAGSAAASDIIPASGNGNVDGTPTNALAYQISNLTATYDASKTTQFKLYIDAASTVGNGTQARVSYDFTGDGTWDRVETYNYFATDPVTGWELYDQTRGLRSTSGAFANLSNGKVRVEIWNAIGSGTSLVRTSASSANGQQSTITLPFN